ncbi:GNAT family N-acetyltransferase [Xenophilus aerolatus]|nr:GNAT family N-acetyltransferase [Xenophilus aerolatus]
MNAHRVQLRDFVVSDLAGVYQVLVDNGWGHRIDSAEDLRRLVQSSHRTAVATVDGQVAGFARAITDGLSNGYLSMVVVAQPWRRQGVGRALVQHIVGADLRITWVLRAGRTGAPDFFAKLGFVPSADAMELRRR